MALIIAGISHHTAPIDVRERVTVSTREAPALLDALRAASGAREAVVLSTCNRTELYLVAGERDPVPAAWALLSGRLGADASRYGYVRRDREAAAHLFRVTAGMDSMILGEAQIQGQVRDAWECSRESSGAVLNRLFQTAQMVGALVRERTAIGRGAASAGSAAVQLARKIFGSLQGRRAMVLGAGEMAELALRCLIDEGVRAAIVANRTHDRARQLAEQHGATALHYDAAWMRLAEVDVLLCSTASPHPIVTRALVEPALRSRGDTPLCVLDIAVPRDVASDVGDLDNVFLYDVDDLRAVVASNLEERRRRLPEAEALIAAEVEQFWQWLAGLSTVPVLTAFRSRMDGVRERELQQALRRLSHLAEEDRAAIEHFSRALMNKFLHEPSVRLRAAASNGRGLGAVDALRYLFALGEPDGGDGAPEARPAGASDADLNPEQR